LAITNLAQGRSRCLAYIGIYVSQSFDQGLNRTAISNLTEGRSRCLVILADRHTKADAVLHSLTDLFIEYGVQEHIRSDSRPKCTAKAVRKWLAREGAKILFIEPRSPWENGYNENFNTKL
jgi:IS30 family transposase